MKIKNTIVILLLVIFATAVFASKAKPTVFTIGDSTVQRWDPASSPKTGWGQLLNYFFNPDSVNVVNKAVGGTTAVTYYTGSWAGVKASVKAGDFVFIQFGINDSFKSVDSTTFKNYLTNFVTETQALGAIPVLMTPMNGNSPTNGTYGIYPALVRQLSTSIKIPLIDLDAVSKTLLSNVGYNYASNYIYMNLAPGDYINWPIGSNDNTHFQKNGATEMARLVVQGIKNLSTDVNVKTLIPYLAPTYKVTFNSNNPVLGTISRTEYFPAGLTVTAKAMSTASGKFDRWSGDLTSTAPIDSFVMGTVAKTINANFISLLAQNKLLNGTFTDSSTVQVSCNKGLVKLVGPTSWSFGGQYKGVTMWGDNIFKRMNTLSTSGHPVYQINGYGTAYADTMFQYVTLTAGKYSFSGAFKGGSIGTASVNLIVNKVGQSTSLLSTSIPNLPGFNSANFINYSVDIVIPTDGIYRIALSANNPGGGWIWLGFADFTFTKSKPTVHTIGDSTVAVWPSANYPQTGWGQLFNCFFNQDSIAIDDKAVSGTSSKTYYSTWKTVKPIVKPGDYVFIQFGINDGSLDPSTVFKDSLSRYVNETQALGAFPVLITPMNNNLLPNGSWGLYPAAIRQLAVALNVPLIDLDASSKALLSSVGHNYSTNYIFMNLAAGDYPNFPSVHVDNTHFQEMGAIEMAKLVVLGIKNLNSDPNIKKIIPFLSPTYQVTFTSNNSSLGMVTRSESFPAGITVTAKAMSNPGATFTGWSGDLTDTKAISSFVMGTTPKTINANFSSVTGLAENAKLNTLSVFPNPVSGGKIHVKATLLNSSKAQLSVTNLVGDILLTRTFESIKSECLDEVVDLSVLPKGIYVLALQSNDGKKTLKLFCN